MIRPVLLLTAAAITAAMEVEPAKLATADAAPLDPGAIEVALGATWTVAGRALDADGRSQERAGELIEAGAGVGITYGLVEGVDAGIGLGWTRVSDEAGDPDDGAGLTDLELALKWRVWQGAGGDGVWAWALLPAVTVPMGHGQDHDTEIPTASRCWTASLALAASGNVGGLALNADLGYAQALGSEGDREGYLGTYAADAAIGFQLSEAVQPEIDLSWTCDRVEEGGMPWLVAVTAGVQLGLPIGRLGLGLQRVVDGAGVDETGALIADLAIAFE